MASGFNPLIIGAGPATSTRGSAAKRRTSVFNPLIIGAGPATSNNGIGTWLQETTFQSPHHRGRPCDGTYVSVPDDVLSPVSIPSSSGPALRPHPTPRRGQGGAGGVQSPHHRGRPCDLPFGE